MTAWMEAYGAFAMWGVVAWLALAVVLYLRTGRLYMRYLRDKTGKDPLDSDDWSENRYRLQDHVNKLVWHYPITADMSPELRRAATWFRVVYGVTLVAVAAFLALVGYKLFVEGRIGS